MWRSILCSADRGLHPSFLVDDCTSYTYQLPTYMYTYLTQKKQFAAEIPDHKEAAE